MSFIENKQIPYHEALYDQLQGLPRLAEDDPRMLAWAESGYDQDKMPSRQQFGNNFYLFFYARNTVRTQPEQDDLLVEIYWDPVQDSYPDAWSAVEANNQELMTKIDEVLADLQKFGTFEIAATKLLFSNQGLYVKLCKLINHPLNYEAYAIPLWDRMNPLLEEAYKKMREAGIEIDLLR